MSERLRRVEQVLRRELAAVIIEGELRDPRLAASAAIAITAVRVSADLSAARVYVDVLSSEVKIERVLAALNSAKSAARARLCKRINLKRIPRLSFYRDDSIANGVAIERVLCELAEERAKAQSSGESSGDSDAKVDTDALPSRSEDDG
ncbi:MAG: 30S ribosome-binding factor RbfA [Nannocystaceae bacterium]|nr:30S ribosome-binding factor RbfA [Nannocystaceae bacterium]